jgi:glycine cleavage system transcriptional repressor
MPGMQLALSAIGRDRPGIVAAVSEVLLDNDGNVEDSTMAILRGHFTMMLIVSVPDEVEPGRLRARLDEVRERLGLEALTLSEIQDVGPAPEPIPSHILSVYGVDHPGILHAVSSGLAEQGVNITDLTTRVIEGEEGAPVYAMMLEVAVPAQTDVGSLERALARVRGEQGVELSFRELERDIL